jgi:hypothetical protein
VLVTEKSISGFHAAGEKTVCRMGSFHRNHQNLIHNSIVVQIEEQSLLSHSLEDLKKDRHSLIVRMIQSEKVDPRPLAGQKE